MPLAAAAGILLAAILIALLVDRVFYSSSSPSGAGTGSGVAATQPRSLPFFTGLELAGNNNVIVHIGGMQSVVVHADDNLLGRVTTHVRSGRLGIGSTPGTLNAKSPMFVNVSVPSLSALILHGSGNITVIGISSQSLTAFDTGKRHHHRERDHNTARCKHQRLRNRAAGRAERA